LNVGIFDVQETTSEFDIAGQTRPTNVKIKDESESLMRTVSEPGSPKPLLIEEVDNS
jgi:hypothetical protein